MTYVGAVTVVCTAGFTLLLLTKNWFLLLLFRRLCLFSRLILFGIVSLQIFIDFLANLLGCVFVAGNLVCLWLLNLLVHLWQIV